MSDDPRHVEPGSYPLLSVQQLEVLPVLSTKLQYFEIPTLASAMSQDEKIQLLDVILKCFVHEVSNLETGFKITYLLDDSAASSIRAINSGFSWVRPNMYCLLALLNFIPNLLTSASTTSTRASSAQLRDELNKVVSHDNHTDLLQTMKSTNPDITTWDNFQYFVKLASHVAEGLTLQISKIHYGILLYYDVFLLETRITGLQVSSSQMLLGLTSKDQVLENAKQIHKLRDKLLNTYKTFLKISNNSVQEFLKCIFPQISSSNVFDYDTFKTSLINGAFGDVFYFQTDPIPLACLHIKKNVR